MRRLATSYQLSATRRYHTDALIQLVHSQQDSQTPSTYIVSGSEDGKIVFWDLQTRQIKYELDGLDGVVQAVAVSNCDFWGRCTC